MRTSEQANIASALVFEFSKVEHVHVREAMVGHLRHIEEDLAKRVAEGLTRDRRSGTLKGNIESADD